MLKFKNKRKPYSAPEISPLAMEVRESLLGASIVTEETLIESVGQELGPTYDFSNEIDSNTGKTFSHEWETGGTGSLGE